MLYLHKSKNEKRRDYLNSMLKIVEPVLVAGSKRELKKTMTIQIGTDKSQGKVAWLEAVGRTVSGISGWLTAIPENDEEEQLQKIVTQLTIETISGLVDPQSPDYSEFKDMHISQILVDLAFLAQGMMRAKEKLIDELPNVVKQQLIKVFVDSRKIMPWNNNWLFMKNQTLKKVIATALAAALSVSILAGCNNKPTTSTSSI